ncbi:DUF6037 family protein [Lacrimispora sp.]|uniref:DUF6037 family protein n=1 Tax=Lacrimispora sp. TaxID=2719234 RepID=UPI0028A6B7EC|nr:DUF6037 family protein [Lacrimispora sp.]
MKMFEFTGLRILHNDMKIVGEKRAIFTFEYNKKGFSCIFLTDITPYRLYLTTLGTEPIVFEFEVYSGYKVKCYIEEVEYKKLIKYLSLEYSSVHKFMPIDFFEALNRKIPIKFDNRPSYSEVIKVASKRRRIEEMDKVYFCGWRRNPIGSKVSIENLEKIRSAFGEETARISKEKNISSCWTDQKGDETLKKLSELNAM